MWSKNIIIFFLIGIIVVLGGILVFSNIQNKSSLVPPKLLVSEEEWDFGKVIQGEKPTHTFIVKNEGKGDLIIEGLKESCSCIEVSISNTLIQPGESAEIRVSYDTTDYQGKDEKHFHIYSNDLLVPDKRINLYVEIEAFQIPQIPYLND